MNPFFFGSAKRALYGTYHPGQARVGVGGGGGADAPGGVVLCGPFGVEYMRSHRAFRQLTTLLTRAGHPVLRFDYGGTGDSAGEGRDQRLEDWVGDVAMAVEELQDTAGIEEVTLVGLRLGALLAVEAARTGSDGVGGGGVDGVAGGAGGVGGSVRRLVLWDPVAEGDAWLREILGGAEGVARTEVLLRAPGGDGVVGVGGFPLPRAIFDALRGRDLEGTGLPPGLPVDLVVSQPWEGYSALDRRMRAAGVASELHVVPSEGNWAEGDAFGSALLPQGIIQAIVERLTGAGSPTGVEAA